MQLPGLFSHSVHLAGLIPIDPRHLAGFFVLAKQL
jgi:hypothetical protein